MSNLVPSSNSDAREVLRSTSVKVRNPGVEDVPSPVRPRYDYMDSLRATLIIAGVFFHAALPYRTTGHWNVQEAKGAAAFDYLTETLTSFRMATFFIVAGFFCAMTFSMRSASSNLRRRLTVFSVPLVTFVVAIQPVQFALRWLHEHPIRGASSIWSAEFWQAYISTGAFISHLWFLVNLICYYVLVRGAMEVFARNPELRTRSRDLLRAVPLALLRSKTAMSIVSLLLISPWLVLVSDSLPQVPGLDVDEILAYLPFFLVGSLLFHSPAALEAFCFVSPSDFAVLLAAIGTLGSGWANGHFLHELLLAFLSWQTAWTIGGAMLSAFRRWFNVENAVARAVSDASYTIYLFHHIVVIVLATMLLDVAIPGGIGVKYLVVVALTCVVTFSLHHFAIRRSMVLSRLFNGRPAPRPWRTTSPR